MDIRLLIALTGPKIRLVLANTVLFVRFILLLLFFFEHRLSTPAGTSNLLLLLLGVRTYTVSPVLEMKRVVFSRSW